MKDVKIKRFLKLTEQKREELTLSETENEEWKQFLTSCNIHFYPEVNNAIKLKSQPFPNPSVSNRNMNRKIENEVIQLIELLGQINFYKRKKKYHTLTREDKSDMSDTRDALINLFKQPVYREGLCLLYEELEKNYDEEFKEKPSIKTMKLYNLLDEIGASRTKGKCPWCGTIFTGFSKGEKIQCQCSDINYWLLTNYGCWEPSLKDD